MTITTPLAALFGVTPAAWALIAVALAVGSLTLLIAWAKVQPLLAFVAAALIAALLLGVPLESIPKSIDKGIGDLLGSLIVIVCLGAVFGKLIADSGAAQRIASYLIGVFGSARMPVALTLTGFVAGIPLYYNVGFVLLVPLVFSLVYQSGRPAVALAIPLLAGLSIAHGFLPPHPSPTALVAQFHADMGRTLFYGLIVAVPTLIIAGPVFALTLKRIQAEPAPMFRAGLRDEAELPGVFNSFATALLPVWLLAAATGASMLPIADPALKSLVAFLANPMIVMLLALLVAVFTLGVARGQKLPVLMAGAQDAMRDIAPILLVIAGAGALKQVLVDSGVSAQLGTQLGALPVPPLVLGWIVATLIRICLGSATVAGLTAAGIVAPVVQGSGIDPSLMVLAIGAGSLMCSHVNDSGFWMFKEYFGLSLKDTFRSWTLMETLVGVFGLVFVLILSAFIG
ncbi:Gnt-I system high-affinity gluconate transporter [Duganella sp. SG902]|uniref:GntT/GntP/DsdX family permease n=1 Tax=Duganella sp. SG902 TaxID=2587016 RepID=UPI00159E1C8C|nr:gluconate:H+ symporter [Duganella sp. SG902]NVM74409.1 Gnt-I system high-affinity gluconate transporter [Duganella sp. SG902]